MATVKILAEKEDSHGKYLEFTLSNKPDLVFKCDIQDIDILSCGKFQVHCKSDKRKSLQFYIRRIFFNENKRYLTTKYFHREIIGTGPFTGNNVVDHIDRDTLNCRRHNLRVVDVKGNAQNNVRKEEAKKRCIEIFGELFDGLHVTLQNRKRRKGKRKMSYVAHYNKKYLYDSVNLDRFKLNVLYFLNAKGVIVQHSDTKKEESFNHTPYKG